MLDLTNGEVIPIDELPTSDEADALLREDSVPGSQKIAESDPDSPTAAVKSAIEAQISENLDSLSNNVLSVSVSNKDVIVDSIPPPGPCPSPPFPSQKTPTVVSKWSPQQLYKFGPRLGYFG